MQWKFKELPPQEEVERLSQSLNIPMTVATLLIQRGISTFEQARTFYRPSLDDLHDPFLMKDMDKAVQRINHALTNNERILIYGDYDVDGTTSVALMATYLETKSKLIGSVLIPVTLLISGFANLTLSPEMQKSSPLVPALQSNWLMMHVSMMLLSYATLIMGSLLCILFLVISRYNFSLISKQLDFHNK